MTAFARRDTGHRKIERIALKIFVQARISKHCSIMAEERGKAKLTSKLLLLPPKRLVRALKGMFFFQTFQQL